MSEQMPIPIIIRLDDRLANGRGMTDCELVGIMGWCGEDCHILKKGKRFMNQWLFIALI